MIKMIIAIIGLGALGSRSAEKVVNLFPGHTIYLIDRDVVEQYNLDNQNYFAEDIGKPKSEVLALRYSNYSGTIISFPIDITQGFIWDKKPDIILDGLDSFDARRVVNNLKIPYIFASALQNNGMVVLFNYPNGPCLDCVFIGKRDSESCVQAGIDNLTAEEVTRIQLDLLQRWSNNLLDNTMYTVKDQNVSKISINKKCSCTNIKIQSTKILKLCGKNIYQVFIDEFITNKLLDGKTFLIKPPYTIFKGRVLIKANSLEEANRLLEDI